MIWAPQLSQPGVTSVLHLGQRETGALPKGREKHFCSQHLFPAVLTPRRSGQAGTALSILPGAAKAVQKLLYPYGVYPGGAAQIQHQGTYQLISTWLKVEKSVFFPPSQGSSYTSRWSPGLSISSSLLPYQMSTAAHKIAGSSGLIPPIPELTFLLHN
ncbi:hypothetical protein RLOC_00011507 [Lonchura striata]|uniref:Uncharacterized protein n=1 Tax=Lonchura striata TaxID=40157 RepID=A0A218ULC6_9PASE|nr:hypothetical protein RLOC_00011507 [Lonchura striata domestica]